MPRREKDEDEDYSEGNDDHAEAEGDDGEAQGQGEESEHSFVGSLSEASDHISGGIDDTSSHVDDPATINVAQKQKPAAKKPAPKKALAKKPATKKKASADEESETGHPSASEDEESDDDEDYTEEASNDEGEDESFDEDDDEDCGATTSRKRKAPARKKTTTTTKGKGRARKPPARKAPARKAPAKKAKQKMGRAEVEEETEESSSSSSEEDDSDEYEEEPKRGRGRATRGKRKSPRRNARGKKRASYKDVGSSGEEKESVEYGKDEDSDDESNSDGSERPQCKQSAAKGRPSRAASAKATAKMAQLKYKEDQADAEEEEDIEEPKPRVAKKRKVDSDEEDFKIDEEAEKEQENEDAELEVDAKSSGEESFLKGVHSVPSDSQVGNADSSDFCEDEASDDGSNKGKAKAPRAKNGAHGHGSAAHKTSEKYFSNTSDDEAEIEPTPTKGRLSQEETIRPAKRRSKNAPPRLPDCPSEVDAITTDPLPPIHVCYVAPDGKSRQCFSLETLHKIATVSQHPQYRTNLSNEQQLTFLQPPHFRSAMADELLDQIASRFGRQALNLNGEFYSRNQKLPASAAAEDDDEEEDMYQVNFTAVHTNEKLFMSSWKEYQMRSMGSQDLYPCPCCYAVSYHRLISPEHEESDGEIPIPLPQEFKYDPMRVLGSPDNSDYEIAANFCFSKISKVKEHLRKEHKCNTARLDNAVFFRYKVRAPDGLLQRYLATKSYSKHAKQGDMRRYWYEGNSESYIYLLYQIEKLRHRTEAREGNDNKELDSADDADPSKSFFQSFQDTALDLWERISAPFSAAKEQDMRDFLDDGEEKQEGDDYVPHHVFDQEEAAAAQEEDAELVRYYKEKAAETDDNSDASRYSDEDENEDDYEPAEASESEEDEWVAGIRNKKKRNSLTPGKKNGVAKAKGARRLPARKQQRKNDESSDDDDDEELDSEENVTSSKRAILEDSDSE